MDLHLDGHRVLITGAASGIGLATARLLAQEGCDLLLWDISSEVLQVAKTFPANITVHSQQMDICDFANLQAAVAEDQSRHAPLDHVIHCAAIGSQHFGFPFTNVDPRHWNRVLEVNIMGTTHVAHALTPWLVQRPGSTFVFVASVAGQMGSQTDPPYSASKAANINFAQCMAKDLAPHGVRVNTVCPGMVQTPLNESVWKAWYDSAEPKDRLDYETWAQQKIQKVVPLGRWQTCDDIAAMIVFLSSQRTKEVTGQTINVDGGFVMHC